MDMVKDDYVTVNAAAEYLGIHQQTVRDAIERGAIRSERRYDRLVVSMRDVEAYRARTRPDGIKPRGRPKKNPDAKE